MHGSEKNGAFEGIGTYWWDSGQTYTGHWKQGLPDGTHIDMPFEYYSTLSSILLHFYRFYAQVKAQLPMHLMVITPDIGEAANAMGMVHADGQVACATLANGMKTNGTGLGSRNGRVARSTMANGEMIGCGAGVCIVCLMEV